MMSKDNIRLQHNTFIDNIYDVYVELDKRKAFTEQGYESGSFKVWKHDEEYFILDKDFGILVTWHKLLGWNTECNIALKDATWVRLCNRLKVDLQIE